ncbi:MAG: hypothetical protein ACTH6F_07995, partial [Halomonas sp.]
RVGWHCQLKPSNGQNNALVYKERIAPKGGSCPVTILSTVVSDKLLIHFSNGYYQCSTSAL